MFIVSALVVFGALRLVAMAVMAVARRVGRPQLDGAAPRRRQHLPSGRADADGRDLARPRPRRARHRDRDRCQPAPGVRDRAPREGAVVLLPRYSGTRSRALRHFRTERGAACRPRARPHAARPDRLGARCEGRGTRTQARRGMGAAERPRAHLHRRFADRFAADRGRVVGQGLFRPGAGLVREEGRRGAGPQDRRRGRRQRARPEHDRPRRQSAHRRLAVARHQLRHGVLARRLRRRAGGRHRHRHLPRRRQRCRGDRR